MSPVKQVKRSLYDIFLINCSTQKNNFCFVLIVNLNFSLCKIYLYVRLAPPEWTILCPFSCCYFKKVIKLSIVLFFQEVKTKKKFKQPNTCSSRLFSQTFATKVHCAPWNIARNDSIKEIYVWCSFVFVSIYFIYLCISLF